MNHILCPVDFSPITACLVRYAAGLARTTGAPLHLLHVVTGQAHEAAAPWRRTREQQAAAQLHQLAAEGALAGLAVTTAVRFGLPGPVIVAAARAWPPQTLVIGAHGTTGLTHFLMGGTAEAILRAAPCATLLVAGARPTAPPVPAAAPRAR